MMRNQINCPPDDLQWNKHMCTCPSLMLPMRNVNKHPLWTEWDLCLSGSGVMRNVLEIFILNMCEITASSSSFAMEAHVTCAVDLRFLCADNIHSDRCRVPLVPLLCFTVTTATRSLWTAAHTVVAAMSMIWSVLSAAVQLHKGNSCWNITGGLLRLLGSITHTQWPAQPGERAHNKDICKMASDTQPHWCVHRCDVVFAG